MDFYVKVMAGGGGVCRHFGGSSKFMVPERNELGTTNIGCGKQQVINQFVGLTDHRLGEAQVAGSLQLDPVPGFDRRLQHGDE